MGEAKRRKDLGQYPERSRVSTYPFVSQAWRLRYVAHPKAVITVATAKANYQICHLMFAKDGSIFVQFPYFENSVGLISSVEHEPTLDPPKTIHLTDRGRVTSHLVKFSHHPDGRVHFSQDGRIRTEIRRRSFPLNGPIGTVFQLHAYDLTGFTSLELDKAKKDRVYLQFGFLEPPEAIMLTAQWRRKKDIEANIRPYGQTIGPFTQVLSRRTGRRSKVYFFGQPAGFPFRDHVLMIECVAIDLLENVSAPLMVFMGGWDVHEVSKPGESAIQTGFLASMYPVESPEELRSTIGSIDFMPASASALE